MTHRDVISADPSLSDEANGMLTQELRSVVGSNRVDIDGDDPDQRHTRHARRGPWFAALYELRIQLVFGAIVLVVVAVLALAAQSSAWLIVVPLALLVGGLVIVVRMIGQVTSETEHVSPGLAARLESEGVADPDEMFTEVLADFASRGADRSAGSMLRPGQNARTGEAEDDPAGAAQEQRTSQTPTSHASAAAGAGANDEDRAA